MYICICICMFVGWHDITMPRYLRLSIYKEKRLLAHRFGGFCPHSAIPVSLDIAVSDTWHECVVGYNYASYCKKAKECGMGCGSTSISQSPSETNPQSSKDILDPTPASFHDLPEERPWGQALNTWAFWRTQTISKL